MGESMSQNEFTKKNHNLGINGQMILDAGLNVFSLQLLIESFTQLAGTDTSPLEFTYLGVNVKLQINKEAVNDSNEEIHDSITREVKSKTSILQQIKDA